MGRYSGFENWLVPRAVSSLGARGLGVLLIVLGLVGCGLDDGGAARMLRDEDPASPRQDSLGAESGSSANVAPPGFASQGPVRIESLRIRRRATGDLFDALGRPVAPEGSDRDPPVHDGLLPLPGYNQFWFAWAVFNDGSSIFGQDEPLDSGPIVSEDECAVPCEEIRLGCPGKDCIPALIGPVFVNAEDPKANYLAEESFVVGVSVGEDTRAYPHNVLWWHEIVNDVVGGEPIAVTHCPLTFSSLGHDPTAFIEGETVELGVSGRLYNSNLVFYNRSDDTYFSQLLGQGTVGEGLGRPAPRVHVWEMTWGAWRALHPETVVMSGDSSDTGHARDYERYPYGGYFTNHSDTFSRTNPAPDNSYQNKQLTYGLRHGTGAKAYVHDELARWADETYGSGTRQGLVMDTVGGLSVAVVFDLDAAYVQAFDVRDLGELEVVR